jgi:carboxymethylenebutenolidase
LATRVPDLAAGVPFYGVAPPADRVAGVKTALLLVYADNDDRVNATFPAYEAALKPANVKFDAVKYPGTQHGFNNDTTPRYDETAARQAWARAVALFNRVLRG